VSRRQTWFALAALALVTNSCGAGVAVGQASPTPTGIPLGPVTASPALATDWTEYHGSTSRFGLGPATPGLSSPRVAWTVRVDGAVYASPLIVAGHVIVATENNSVYSLDLFTGATVWMTHLGDPVDAASLPCGDIGPVSGITGTPAAEPATGRLYVVAFLRGGHHMLYAMSLADGSVVGQQDVDPPGSNPTVQQQRGALSLASGYVYVPLGGLYGDCGAYHGYIEAVPDAFGPALLFRVSGNRGAGIWSPQGATIDSAGDVYVVTGNSTSQSAFDYSESVVELSSDLQSVKSYFAPSNWIALNNGDIDLGSVGATVMPPDGAVLAIGKAGVAYRLEAGRLGGVGGQVASAQVCAGAWGGTAWSGSTVFVPCADGLYALSLAGPGVSVEWHAGHPVVGSPIIAAGAVWAIDQASATLYALDPASGSILYSLGLGEAEHFSTAAATEGFVVAPAGQNVVAVSTAG